MGSDRVFWLTLYMLMYLCKGVMIVGLLISSLSPLLLVGLQLQSEMSPFWYYLAGAVSGLVSWIGVALSTLSDVMPPHWRAPSFGLLLVGFSVGFAVAPQLAFLLGHFWVSVMSLASIWFGIIVLVCFFPETLPPEMALVARLAREEQVEGLSSSQKALWSMYRPIWELSILNRNRLFRLLSCLAFFSGMVSSGE
jgi:MFS family permease